MNSAADNRETARQDAKRLLDRVGIGRILMVDDEYAAGVGVLLGMCEELGSAHTAELPYLQRVRPEDPDDVRNDAVREAWEALDHKQRRGLLARARKVYAAATGARADGGPKEDPAAGDDIAASSLDDVLADLDGLEFVPLSLVSCPANTRR